MPHLILAPIVLPLLTAGLMLLLREEQQRLKVTLNLGSTVLGLLVAIALLPGPISRACRSTPGRLYLPGQLACALWHCAGAGQALGHDAGAVLQRGPGHSRLRQRPLAPGRRCISPPVPAPADGPGRGFSHGRSVQPVRVLSRSCWPLRTACCCTVRAAHACHAGLHYIAINLAASSLFLIGASMLYGITGTLNMADLARSMARCGRQRPGPAARCLRRFWPWPFSSRPPCGR